MRALRSVLLVCGLAAAGSGCGHNAPPCGDGEVNPEEDCDDGNVEPGDGCDENCHAEDPACGDGRVTQTPVSFEECDDGNQVDGDGCSADCLLENPSPGCGNGADDPGEGCDDGDTDAGDGCSTGCQEETGYDCTGTPSVCGSVCGDGLRVGGEGCDDGGTSASDGCSAGCQEEPNWSCTGTPSTCTGVCGDGVIVGLEGCDDAAIAPNDGCSAGCQEEAGYDCIGQPSVCGPVCGDGLRVGTEGCDDGNAAPNDGCSAGCQEESGYDCTGQPSVCGPVCGDGLRVGTEGCDDGNTAPNDGCSAVCLEELGYDCTGQPSVCGPVCGDVMLVGTEICDGIALNGQTCVGLGHDEGTLACTLACTFDESGCIDCGDNVSEGSEQCDGTDLESQTCASLGFNSGTLSCTPTCTFTGCGNSTCGNGVIEFLEQCDDGNTNTGDGCGGTCQRDPGYTCTGQPSACTLTCGNGVLDANETCDDANRAGLDGCDFNCSTEPGFTCAGAGLGSCTTPCGDGVTRGFEACDDNNGTPGDGCTACKIDGAIDETEPNDDGNVGVFAFDFSAANADGPFEVGTRSSTVISARIFSPTGQPGDDDTFAIHNGSAATKFVRVDTYAASSGLGNPCDNLHDTSLAIRNAAGALLASNEDRAFPVDRCSGLLYGIPAGQTVYVHVIDFLDNNTIPSYLLLIESATCGDLLVEVEEECEPPGGATCTATCTRVPSCSDGLVDAPETCDDGNLTSADGCSSTCQAELFVEVEPNDDGATAISTNDFSAAAANGPITSSRIFQAAITPAGDDDCFAVTNPTASPIVIRAETWSPALGIGVACGTTLNMTLVGRDAAGTQLVRSDDRHPSADQCAGFVMTVPAGQTLYLHATRSFDNALSGPYLLEVTYP